MDSFLISGALPEDRFQKAKELAAFYQISLVDTLILEPQNSIGIGEVRELKRKISLKPYQSKKKAGIINGAEKLTFEAQTALLKTLEEPPANTIIILTSPREDFLLPTIVSRCQIIKLEEKPEIELTPEVFGVRCSVFSSLLNLGVGERIKMAGEIAKTREETIKWLEEATIVLREILLREFRTSVKTPPRWLSGKCETRVAIIRRLGAIKRLIEKNVNFRLSLEVFFLSLPKIPIK